MQRVTLDQVDVATVTAALSAAYTGYFVPLTFSETATTNYLRVHDIAAQASPVWMNDGRPVAIGAVGVREDRAWVGAFGIAPEFRGKGLAQAMFGEVIRLAKRQAVKTIQLEVLQENERARAVYLRAGFKDERKLLCLEGPAPGGDPQSARKTDVERLIRTEIPQAPPECWQREPATLRRRAHEFAAFESGRSFALYRAGDGEASLWKTSLDGGGDAVLAAVASHTAAHRLCVTNEPEGSPLLLELYRRAWSVTAVQYEMRLKR